MVNAIEEAKWAVLCSFARDPGERTMLGEQCIVSLEKQIVRYES